MRTILCFGNEFVAGDSFAKVLAVELQSSDFLLKPCDSVEEVLRYREDHPKEQVLIMDVMKGIASPLLVTDLSRIRGTSSASLHDFDLAFFLKLLEATGQLGPVAIICVPMEGNLEMIKCQVQDILKSIPSQESA